MYNLSVTALPLRTWDMFFLRNAVHACTHRQCILRNLRTSCRIVYDILDGVEHQVSLLGLLWVYVNLLVSV